MTRTTDDRVHEVVVVGAGFGAVSLAHSLLGVGLAVDDVVVLERGDGVGGTWRANRYPGAACDVPSHLYSLSWAPNPDWSRTYATQPEILRYAEDCYDRLGLRSRVRTGTTACRATWSEADGVWTVEDTDGGRHRGRFLVPAIGMFHTPVVPDLPGRDDFGGRQVHSARWDPDLDVADLDVAVIGTGASAVQLVPAIADRARSVVVHQRTPAWILPRLDEPFTGEQRRTFAEAPEVARALRDELHRTYEANTSFLLGDPVGAFLADLAREHLEQQVPAGALRDALRPTYPIGCKRMLVSSDFYPALCRDDVTLVTTPIERITVDGVRTEDGCERGADLIAWCTGFRATDYLHGLEIRGRDGVALPAAWQGVPRAFHGMSVPGVPNMFMMYGPNTNQGGNSILLMLEAQADHIAAAVAAVRDSRATSIEVTAEAMARYEVELAATMTRTVWVDGCDSYFRTATGEVVTQLPHTTGWYREHAAPLDLADHVLGRRDR